MKRPELKLPPLPESLSRLTDQLEAITKAARPDASTKPVRPGDILGLQVDQEIARDSRLAKMIAQETVKARADAAAPHGTGHPETPGRSKPGRKPGETVAATTVAISNALLAYQHGKGLPIDRKITNEQVAADVIAFAQDQRVAGHEELEKAMRALLALIASGRQAIRHIDHK